MGILHRRLAEIPGPTIMALISFCPACKTQHTFPDLLYGKNVRCKNCQKCFYAGQPEKGANEEPAEDQEAVTAGAVGAGAPKTLQDRPARFHVATVHTVH